MRKNSGIVTDVRDIPEDGRPYAYQTGKVEFFYLPFRSDERALVPRFETESLVREALATLKSSSFSVVVDVGTGSGIIAVTIAKHFPNVRMIGLDISHAALSLAQENAELNGVCSEWYQSDLLSGLPNDEGVVHVGGILFVANLPYIRNGDRSLSSDTAFEPPEALYGGSETGFELTRRLLEEIEDFHKNHPSILVTVLCEVGDDHGDEIHRAARELHHEIRIFPDLTGINRFFTYRIWPS